MLNLDDIRERRAAITPGPWWNESLVIHSPTHHICNCDRGNGEQDEVNAAFIANAPLDIDLLIAELLTVRVAVRILIRHLDAGSPPVMRDAAAEYLRRLVDE